MTKKPNNTGLKNPIRSLLLKGLSVKEVAKKRGISTNRVYEYAIQHSLPVNTPLVPRSALSLRILKQASVLGIDKTAANFRLTPTNVRKHIALLKKLAASKRPSRRPKARTRTRTKSTSR